MAFPFRLYGHRGAAAHHPENTMASFRAALEAGADALETDVRLTSDGEVVVFHDADGARTCGDPRLVRACDWRTVSGWDAGRGERPVRLSDLLEALPDVFVNVDLKDDLPEAADNAVAVVRAARAEARVGLGSFHGRVARAARRAGWRGQLALTTREVAAARLLPAVLARPWIGGDAAQIPVAWNGVRLDRPGLVARCHALGLRVDYWTIDDPAEAVRLVGIGADGIVTNDPAAVGEALVTARTASSRATPRTG
jgi:glycerophosphoryl diester phosphodiesterase